MSARLLRLVRAHPSALVRLAVITTGFALARSDSGAFFKAAGFLVAGIAAFVGARKAEASLRKTEKRLRAERPRRSD